MAFTATKDNFMFSGARFVFSTVFHSGLTLISLRYKPFCCRTSYIYIFQAVFKFHISLIAHFVAPPPPPFATTTGKTTPTSASTTYHGAAFPKEAGDPERGTGPDGPPPVGEQGSPDSEPISVEMEGKGVGCLS